MKRRLFGLIAVAGVAFAAGFAARSRTAGDFDEYPVDVTVKTHRAGVIYVHVVALAEHDASEVALCGLELTVQLAAEAAIAVYESH